MFLPGVRAQSLIEQAEAGWPHIRGPSYDGVSRETNLADVWPESGPPVLWVKELGQGFSSIVVQKDRAFTQYQSLTGQFVLCMDANTGKTLWSYRYDWPFEVTGLYPGPYSTPTLSMDHVYFTTPAGSVSCLTLSGKLVWSRDLKQEFDGKGTDFGYACSPTVVDRKVILPVGGRGASLVALDAMSGEVVWKTGDESASYVPVLPITINGLPCFSCSSSVLESGCDHFHVCGVVQKADHYRFAMIDPNADVYCHVHFPKKSSVAVLFRNLPEEAYCVPWFGSSKEQAKHVFTCAASRTRNTFVTKPHTPS